MDSIKETIEKTLQESKISQNTSDEERFPCPHGTMVRKDGNGNLLLWECGDCEREKEKERVTQEKEMAKRRDYSNTMWSVPDIPKRFQNKTITNYKATTQQQKILKETCRKFVENFEKAKDNGTSLVFCGKPGTGKTHLAYAIVSVLRTRLVTAVILSASDMTSEIKDAYKSDDLTPSQVVDKYSKYDLLILDEVGIQVSSEAEVRIFFDVINKRYENMLPTIMISNLELQELTQFVGERVMDRMKENGGVVFAFDWKSYR